MLAPLEETKIRRGEEDFLSSGRNVSVMLITPTRFTARTSRKASRWTGLLLNIPALLTRTSRRP
jgi:hypothetical protein